MIPTTRAASTPSRSVTTSDSNMGRGSLRDGGRPVRLVLRAGVAEAVDLQRVPRGDEAVGAADLGLQRDDPGADELDHPAAAGAHQVIVLLAAVHVLVEEPVALQPLLARQAALDQQVEVAVDRGARDLEAARLHGGEQRLGVDVRVLREDLVEQRQPLGGDALSPLAEEEEESLLLASV